MAKDWIVVPNWSKFQHYKDREPFWIKLYTELNSRDDWLSLSPAQRGLLVTIWIEYGRSRGRLSIHQVLSLCPGGVRQDTWKALNDAGFIRFRSRRPLALVYTRSSPEEVLRTSKKGRRSPKRAGGVPSDNNNQPPAVRDPDAIEKIRELADRIGGPVT
jgi:hypothetical protein